MGTDGGGEKTTAWPTEPVVSVSGMSCTLPFGFCGNTLGSTPPMRREMQSRSRHGSSIGVRPLFDVAKRYGRYTDLVNVLIEPYCYSALSLTHRAVRRSGHGDVDRAGRRRSAGVRTVHRELALHCESALHRRCTGRLCLSLSTSASSGESTQRRGQEGVEGVDGACAVLFIYADGGRCERICMSQLGT